MKPRIGFKPDVIREGDYVGLKNLPPQSALAPKPLRVSEVAPNGMIRLEDWGWFQPHLLMKVPSPEQQARRLSKLVKRFYPQKRKKKG